MNYRLLIGRNCLLTNGGTCVILWKELGRKAATNSLTTNPTPLSAELKMLNRKAILEELNKSSRCQGSLIKQRGMAVEMCAMGALLKGVGVTNFQLEMAQDWGDGQAQDLYRGYKNLILAKYGIENYKQFSTFMEANDNSSDSQRAAAVIEVIEALSPHEVNEILGLDTHVNITT